MGWSSCLNMGTYFIEDKVNWIPLGNCTQYKEVLSTYEPTNMSEPFGSTSTPMKASGT